MSRKKQARIRALVLAQDPGRELQPLSGFLPPVLLPVAGKPVLSYGLEALSRSRVEAAAVCVAEPFGERIERAMGSGIGKLELFWRHHAEPPGSWGAFAGLEDFFSDADAVVVVRGDALCRWPIQRLVRRHLKRDADATLLLSSRVRPELYGGGAALDREGRLAELRPGTLAVSGPESGEIPRVRRRVLTGADVLSPRLLREVEPEGDLLSRLYEPLLRRQARLEALSVRRRWHLVNTPGRYIWGAWDWSRGTWPGRLWRSRYVSPTSQMESGARVRRSVVEGGVRILRRARVDRCVLMNGVTVGEGSRLRSCVVAPGVELPPYTRINGRLVTPLKAGRDPGAHDSVVGDLVYTPIER